MANNKLHSWIKNIRMEWGFDSLAAISRTAAFGTIVALGSMLSSCHDLMHDDLPLAIWELTCSSSTTTTSSALICSTIM